MLLHLGGRQAGRPAGWQAGRPTGQQAGRQEGRQSGHAGLPSHRLSLSRKTFPDCQLRINSINNVYTQLLDEHPELTTLSFNPTKTKHGVEHHIPTEGPPVYARARRMARSTCRIKSRIRQTTKARDRATIKKRLGLSSSSSPETGWLNKTLRRLSTSKHYHKRRQISNTPHIRLQRGYCRKNDILEDRPLQRLSPDPGCTS